MKKIKIILVVFLIALFGLYILVISVGCSKKVNSNTSNSNKTIAASSTSSQNEQSSQETSTSSMQTTSKETTTSTQQIPPDIDQMIKEADNYYNNGQYAEAVSAYRKIKPAVDSNDSLSEEMKNQIINSIEKNFEDAKTITETARMHYGNAMQLEYEKRIQEAINELEEALKIYPKYQDAIDKLNSIKSLYKLK
jgi:tetratricopeptide (TPR) repeat protein